MDIDEHIDLINTLGDMLGQTEEFKMEKFIDTMPTIIQTHLITEKTWQETTDRVKELEHIIRKCDPLAAVLPTLAKGTAVPGLYSHIAHSDDKEETDIPQPFKGPSLSNLSIEVEERENSLHKNQKICQYRHRTILTIMMILTIIIILRIIEANLEDVDPTEAKMQVISLEAKIFVQRSTKSEPIPRPIYQNNGYQSQNYQGNQGFYHNPHRNLQQGNNYSQTRDRSHG